LGKGGPEHVPEIVTGRPGFGGEETGPSIFQSGERGKKGNGRCPLNPPSQKQTREGESRKSALRMGRRFRKGKTEVMKHHQKKVNLSTSRRGGSPGRGRKKKGDHVFGYQRHGRGKEGLENDSRTVTTSKKGWRRGRAAFFGGEKPAVRFCTQGEEEEII